MTRPCPLPSQLDLRATWAYNRVMPRYLATYTAQCVIELEAATKAEADTFALDLFSQPGVIWDNSMHDPVVTEVCVAEKAEGKGNG